MPELSQPGAWLPLVFLLLMGVAMMVYVILDGFDLGVGILLRRADDEEKDMMVASIGPFWDANETWLVLGVGILLVAFPMAHGVILGHLYFPVALMLAGLILRGVAFDFRVKARAAHKQAWNTAFYAGSVLAAGAQGVMIGLYIVGFDTGTPQLAFAMFTGVSLLAGYALLGATWLIMKTEGGLQRKAIGWARGSLLLCALGIAAVSVVTPLVSQQVFDKWFALPNILLLAPVPVMTAALFVVADAVLRRMLAAPPADVEPLCWLPFAATVGIFLLAFNGLAYSVFPYLVVDRITIWQAASAPESLKIILWGVALVLPTIIGYTVFSYRVFRGKARALSYS
ncbi:MAG TPA: cytochrome d ubiquinol oxidase subunit II [Noviherbaspirillum sp.]|uniref:cytochrome d ubiquinol oxidase subunit II n=1 Tax=Noviherbaspirillum sp. TaxID=1926288 RepID=UPI002D73E448|nr:cytochrome d ubiquinol oxidase subunit II [Noviherbaspirillum sp.]HYD97297.1 cytochrome d ubiquinol oxidase subunit II [Noviherbaspirillum sp.]